MKTFKKGGIHPNPDKLTAGCPIEDVEAPQVVAISLAQNIGAPSRCIVKPGQRVARGEMIAEPGGFVSAAVHSPVDGIVKKIEPIRDPQGLWRPGVVIERAPEEEGTEPAVKADYATDSPDIAEIADIAPAAIVEAVKRAGVVGAGGAAFPTHVKLTVPEGKSVDYVLLNGAECEPYLTCDDALMRARASRILRGMALIMRATGASRGVVGIEANKPEAIKAMRAAAEKYSNIKVEKLKTAYPQGSEKQLIYALCRRTVPAGGLPVDAGVIVDNVATAYSVAMAVDHAAPVIERVVTVTGPSLSHPGNYLVPLGTPISRLVEMAGGLPEDTGKVIAGGPMMGKAVSWLDAPSTKGLSGVLVLPERMSRRGEAGPCLRCAKCVQACPMGLEPYLLMTLGERALDDESKAHGALNCLECGSCSYVCPSVRPILDFIRLSRQRLRKK